MNNVLRFPTAQKPQRTQQRTGSPLRQTQDDAMQMIMDRFMSGIQPEQILDQMAGPEVKQAKQIIHGKNPAQLKSIAMNMAEQRGVRLEDLAAQLGVRLPG